MIGQQNLQERLKKQIKDGTFARFNILVGPAGSGKKLLVENLKNYFSDIYLYMLPDIKVDSIRDMITDVYKNRNTVLYVIPDADSMSLAAKNALLKVTEEPPNNAYFIMTMEDENSALATIQSRAAIYHMDRYTPDEIKQYFNENYQASTEYVNLIKDLCETPGEVDLIQTHGPEQCAADHFYGYVEKVVDNIAEVSGANSFKIAYCIALKDELDKYDLRLFWKAFCKVCMDRINHGPKDDMLKYVTGVQVTSKYLAELRWKGVNKQMAFDCWLLDIRKEWM